MNLCPYCETGIYLIKRDNKIDKFVYNLNL